MGLNGLTSAWSEDAGGVVFVASGGAVWTLGRRAPSL
jgi:hypothetical protein